MKLAVSTPSKQRETRASHWSCSIFTSRAALVILKLLTKTQLEVHLTK